MRGYFRLIDMVPLMNEITMEILQFDEHKRKNTAIIKINETTSILVDWPDGHEIEYYDIMLSHGDGWEQIPLTTKKKTMNKIKNVKCNIIRFSPLASPQEWAEGDYTATLEDGTERNATYSECLAFIGLPDMPNVKINS